MHFYLSLLVQGHALDGGKYSAEHECGTALTKCCILRFSEIEQIEVISIIVLHYRITVLEEPQYAHETLEERKTRVLAQDTRILTKLIRTPMMFTPREGENILSY